MGLIINGNEFVSSNKLGAGHNIGDIFYTTRLDNELNGAVECNGSQYNFADINGGDNNIQSLLENGKLPYLPISEFDSMVTEQGGCDSFGYVPILYAWSNSNITVYTLSETPTTGDCYNANGTINVNFSITDVSGLPNSIEVFDGSVKTFTLSRSQTLDLSANLFKVPKKLGRVLVRSQKPTADNNYTWFNVYSDGWVEQGGMNYLNPQSSINLPIQMNGSTYSVFAEGTGISDNNNISTKVIISQTTASVLTIRATFNSGQQDANFNCYWQVVGYAASSEYAQSTWDYQNIKVERPMVQLFNGSTDTALATCTSVLADVSSLKSYDYVVEFQEPTAENGYTWYRLYKSGWVEQGGIVPPLPASVTGSTVTFPIEMSTNRYTCFVNTYSPYVDAVIMYANRFKNLTTTSLTIISLQQNSNSTNYVAQTNQSWQVSGMSA